MKLLCTICLSFLSAFDKIKYELYFYHKNKKILEIKKYMKNKLAEEVRLLATSIFLFDFALSSTSSLIVRGICNVLSCTLWIVKHVTDIG